MNSRALTVMQFVSFSSLLTYSRRSVKFQCFPKNARGHSVSPHAFAPSACFQKHAKARANNLKYGSCRSIGTNITRRSQSHRHANAHERTQTYVDACDYTQTRAHGVFARRYFSLPFSKSHHTLFPSYLLVSKPLLSFLFSVRWTRPH